VEIEVFLTSRSRSSFPFSTSCMTPIPQKSLVIDATFTKCGIGRHRFVLLQVCEAITLRQQYPSILYRDDDGTRNAKAPKLFVHDSPGEGGEVLCGEFVTCEQGRHSIRYGRLGGVGIHGKQRTEETCRRDRNEESVFGSH
jgi:hypothetical protein